MRAVDFLRAVRDGREPAPEDISAFVAGVTAREIPDYQASAFLMAVCLRGLSHQATSVLTAAMRDSGEILDVRDLGAPVVDKHSTGGVGDKISLALAPLAVASGLLVPMIAGRGLGHTGGTIDKLAAIPGFDVASSREACRRRVQEVGACMMGQSERIAPADRLLYALRDVTATVESIPLICASILAKKLAEGIDSLVLDVKVGRGAFMRDVDAATRLAGELVAVGEQLGLGVRAVLTAMDQPLGRTVGNALEVQEANDILACRGPADSTELTVELCAHMLVVGGLEPAMAPARARARRHLTGGDGLEAWRRIIAAHGGDARVVDEPSRLPRAPHQTVLAAPRSAYVVGIDSFAVGCEAVRLGAGRARAEDAIDPRVGMEFHAKVGDWVEAGAPLITVHHARPDVAAAREALMAAVVLGDAPVAPAPLILAAGVLAAPHAAPPAPSHGGT